jgi:hypothetical protein
MDGSLVERAKVQRWQRCRLQRCNSNGGATRNAAVIAALLLLLLELAAMVLLQL